VAGGVVRYVKPHGALYHATVADRGAARAVVEAAAAFDGSLAVLGLPGSALLRVAEDAGLAHVGEAFADRAYRADGTLVPRSEAGSVVVDVESVVERAVRMATDGTVVAVDGAVVRVDARSICVHGDTPGAATLATAVRDALVAAGITVRPFAS
jgi:UPF0271 protein